MNGLKFAMVTTFYPPHNFGGDGIAVQRLSKALVNRGHEVTVLQPLDAHDVLAKESPPPAMNADGRVEVKRFRSTSKHLSVLLTQQLGRPVFAGEAIAKELESRAFDVIVYNNISLAGGPGILARGDAIKIYMAHEHWLVCPMHVLWRHNREPCTGRQCIRCSLAHHRPPQLWRYTGLLERQLDNVDLFFAMSHSSRDKHREFGFTRPMSVLHQFLPDQDFHCPAGETSPAERPYFLFVGRLELIKGLDDVIPLFAGDCGPDLLIVGDGGHGTALRRLAAGNPRVRFMGHIPTEELARFYRHAIALIAPSVGFETFGMTVIEAFRQGTPVLGRALGPMTEILNSSHAGLLFSGPEELRACMARLQAEPGLRAALATSARTSFATHWSESAIVPRFLQLIGDVARARRDATVLRKLEPERGDA